jgi:aminoglycoside phosphotransferase family enzyme/predicted kinase
MSRNGADDAASQEAVFAFLADPATHGGGPVKRIDTHAAVVFLGPTRVFKVKRAVRFPFLDYSSLEKRRQACEAEIAINQPLAGESYVRALPITRARKGSTLELAGAGLPVEWAVEMRRFDENATLDHLARAGKIDVALADALGRAVASAQALLASSRLQHLAPQAPVAPSQWIKALAAYIEEHVEAFAAAPDLFPVGEAAALARASRAAHDRNLWLLEERGERGLVRHIHGDLHLGNIVLLDGRPTLFDAVEFSPLIATGDVLYDLAFLLMDLTERGLRGVANVVLNRYLVETGRVEDLDALAALPLCLSMRAAIRAKVSAARLRFAAADERLEIAASARKYFEFACGVIAPKPPVLVAVGGLSGTGKSLLAGALAVELEPAPGAVVLRSDIERKALFAKREDERLPDAAYSPDVTMRVYATLADKARRALIAGHSAVVDAVFAKRAERAIMQQSAAVLGIAFHGIFLETDLAARLARVRGRQADASDADATVAREQEAYELGLLDWTRVDASGSPEQTLARARAVLHPAESKG